MSDIGKIYGCRDPRYNKDYYLVISLNKCISLLPDSQYPFKWYYITDWGSHGFVEVV